MHTRAIPSTLILALFTLLGACGGGGSSSSSTTTTTEINPPTFSQTVTVTPSLGKISHADVEIYDEAGPAGGNLLAQGNTGSNGVAQIELTTHDLDPIVIRVSGNDQAFYYDEQTGTSLALMDDEHLHAVVERPGSAAVTPLTELAWQIARTNDLLPLDSSEAAEVNEGVRQMLARELPDILLAPTLVDGSTAADSLDDSLANLYTVKLAALATLSPSAAKPALRTTERLIDEMTASVAFVGLRYDLHPAVQAQAALLGNDDLELAARYHALPELPWHQGIGEGPENLIREFARFPDATVYHSVDTDFETEGWSRFPIDTTVGLDASDYPTIALTDGDNPIPGWTVNLDNATVTNNILDPSEQSIQVRFPGDAPNEEKSIRFVVRDGFPEGYRISILTESDVEVDELSFATVPISHSFDDYPESGWQELIADIDGLSQQNRMLTAVRDELGVSDDGTDITKCETYEISGGMLQETPALFLEVNPAQNTGWVNRFAFTHTDYRRGDNISEVWISTYSAVRLNEETNTVTWFEFGNDGEPAAIFTTDADLIARECGG